MGPSSLDDARKDFDKKFKDKSGHTWDKRSEPARKGKYTFLEKNYEDDEDEAAIRVEAADADEQKVESKLPRQTQRLIELIFNQNHFNAVLEHIGYNANKLPLGKLSKATLKQGFEYLHELASLIKHPSLAQNKYSTSQEDVSLLTGVVAILGSWTQLRIYDTLYLTTCEHRRSRTSPTSTTRPFPTNLAVPGRPRSTTTSCFEARYRCSTPSRTWKSPTQS